MRSSNSTHRHLPSVRIQTSLEKVLAKPQIQPRHLSRCRRTIDWTLETSRNDCKHKAPRFINCLMWPGLTCLDPWRLAWFCERKPKITQLTSYLFKTLNHQLDPARYSCFVWCIEIAKHEDHMGSLDTGRKHKRTMCCVSWAISTHVRNKKRFEIVFYWFPMMCFFVPLGELYSFSAQEQVLLVWIVSIMLKNWKRDSADATIIDSKYCCHYQMPKTHSRLAPCTLWGFREWLFCHSSGAVWDFFDFKKQCFCFFDQKNCFQAVFWPEELCF